MILTCPECSTSYMSKEDAIGPNGRSVRCARCETVWFVEGTDPDALALEDNKAVLLTPEPEPQPELPFEAPTSVGAHVLMRDKADAEKLSKRMRILRAIWAIPLILLIGGATTAYLKRQAIVEAYPKTATIYQAFGLKVKQNGLDIKNVSNQMLVVDGETVLRVNGEVENLSSKTVRQETVELSLENRSGETVAAWVVEIGEIKSGGIARFETDYPAPPVDGVDLRYAFTSD